MSLLRLPAEILLEVCSFLPPGDFLKLTSLNRAMHSFLYPELCRVLEKRYEKYTITIEHPSKSYVEELRQLIFDICRHPIVIPYLKSLRFELINTCRVMIFIRLGLTMVNVAHMIYKLRKYDMGPNSMLKMISGHPRWRAYQAIILLHMLPNLEDLVCQQIDCMVAHAQLHIEYRPDSVNATRSVRKLHFRDYTKPMDQIYVQELLTLFEVPGLLELKIDGLNVVDDQNWPDELFPSSSGLKNVECRRATVKPRGLLVILSWLPALETLLWENEHPGEIAYRSLFEEIARDWLKEAKLAILDCGPKGEHLVGDWVSIKRQT